MGKHAGSCQHHILKLDQTAVLAALGHWMILKYIYIEIPSFLLILAKHCHCLLCCLCLSGCQVDRKLLDLGFHLDTFRALLACRNWEESSQQPSIQGVKILKIQQISWYNHTVQFWICIQWYYECLVLRFSPVLNSLTAYADVWSRTVWF